MADTTSAVASPQRAHSQDLPQPPAQQPGPSTHTPPKATNSAQAQSSDLTNKPISTEPLTSSSDPGTAPRPRDARTIHMILSALGVSAYQERVPLQLLDFAYRYTAGILSDAQHLASEGYSSGGAPGNKGAGNDELSLDAVKLAAAGRAGYQFTGGQLPKETLLEIAADRNKIRLPDVGAMGPRFGVRLPHERFLLNGRGWDMNEEWESEVENDEGDDEIGEAMNGAVNGEREQEEDEDMGDGEDAENGEGGFEEVFGNTEDNEDDRMTEEG